MVRSKKGTNQGYWDYARNFAYNAAGAVASGKRGQACDIDETVIDEE